MFFHKTKVLLLKSFKLNRLWGFLANSTGGHIYFSQQRPLWRIVGVQNSDATSANVRQLNRWKEHSGICTKPALVQFLWQAFLDRQVRDIPHKLPDLQMGEDGSPVHQQ